MKRVLMVAPFFPPRRRVGALRSYRLTRWLPDAGWQPAVIALASAGRLTPEEEQALRGIPIHRIPVGFDATESTKPPVPPSRPGTSSRPASQASGESRRGMNPLSAWVDRHMPLDTWWPLLRLHESRMRRFAAEQRPDLVWSTGDPWSSHWLGWRLSKALSIPWVADYRDPWTLSRVQIRDRGALSMRIDRRLERRFLSHAERVVFTCRAAEARYIERFAELKGHTHVVENSAFEAARPEGAGSTSPATPHPPTPAATSGTLHTPLRLLFFGSFRRLSPLEPILDVLHELLELAPRLRHAPPAIRIDHVAALLPEDQAKVDALGLREWFRAIDPVTDASFREVLESGDLLLLSTHPLRDDIIPAKLWDYLLADRPILSLCPNPEVGEWIDRYRAGIQATDAAHAARMLLGALDEGALAISRDPVPIAERMQRISARAMAARMAEVFDLAMSATPRTSGGHP